MEYIQIDLHLAYQDEEGGHGFMTGYKAYFVEDTSDYGNGMYLDLENDKPGYYSPYLDIRYDTRIGRNATDTEKLNYVINYVLTEMYTGRDGSAEVMSIKATWKDDLEGREE